METKEMKNEELEKVAGGMQNGTMGLDCSRCGTFVPVTKYQIFCEETVTCPSCFLRFKLDERTAPLIYDREEP